MKKILAVIGTRPDAIKMAPVIKELEKHSDVIKSSIIATAQHRELLDDVLDVFSIKPDFDLNIMGKGQTLSYVTTRALQKMEPIISDLKPDIILVQGDTTSSFVGALAGFYNKIPVAHVEAGLRSHDKYNPYPEEINRVLIGVMSDICFAPTKKARDNLLAENICKEKIYITGNTAIDALFFALKKNNLVLPENIKSILNSKKRLVLVTAHRRENFDAPLTEICEALIELKNRFKDIQVVYSVHPNPNVKNKVSKLLKNVRDIYLIEPPEYFSFIKLMQHAFLILTDSGGIQEEAPSLNKPILVLRKVTERVEGIKQGTAVLVGTSKDKIVKEASILLKDAKKYRNMTNALNPYGDGKASKRIVNILFKYLNLPYKKTKNFNI